MTLPNFTDPAAGFLGLPPDLAVPAEKARAVIIPFGLESSVSYGGGTAEGPDAIIRASHQVELFDEYLWREPCRDWGVATLDEVDWRGGIEPALDRLAETVAGVLDAGQFPLVLGGEHSLTPGALRPHLLRHGKVTVLQFDAHADLRDGYEGEKFSHAAAMRRCLDHEGVSLLSVGIRNISAGEVPFLEQNPDRITIHWAKDKARWDPAAIMAPLKGQKVYVTFDLDAFDASLMPATGTPEPGGLFWQDAMDLLAAACESADQIVGADIVELAPYPGLHAPDFTAAKLAYRMLAMALRG